MTTGALAVVAGPIPGPSEMKDLLAQRFALSYDISAHVQRAALPVPGDESELFGVIAQALQRPLDADRPPWECWIIEGLPDDCWAVLIKSAQESAAAHLLARLCEDASDMYTDPQAAETRSPVGSASWADIVRQAASRAVSGALRPARAGNRPPTMRRYRAVVVPRGAVDHLSRKFGVPADDVAFTAITAAFRAVLMQRGEQPRADSLRVSGPALTHLPVDHQNPIQQLRALCGQTGPSAAPASPFALCARAFQALTRSPRHAVTLAAAAPGPRFRLRLMGRRLERILPIPPTHPGIGVTVLSYDGDLVFGITADYDAALDIDRLAAGIESGMARLIAFSRDSVVLFDRRRKRRALPNGAARWRPSPAPARVRH
ncbi:wax ester/triacylglycerol synthase domain-containing protein [Mycobacterium sp. ML4]